jgi:hypothetical protein
MGFFDFLNKKEEEPTPESGIEIIMLDDGSHGDNIGGLFGFEFKANPDSLPFIYEQIDKVSEMPIVRRDEVLNTDLKEMSFDTTNENRSRLKLRVIEYEGKMLSAFPYLKTSYSIPFSTRKVHPWNHVGEIEAEVYGGGRNTFGLGFFATDYFFKEEIYQNTAELDIHISAIGLVLDRFETASDREMKFDPEFASYMPSKELNRVTYYDFVGKILDFEKVQIAEGISGYITRVKLINDPNDPDFFTVDMFINQQNMRIPALEKGMSVSGLLWFQGEIKA